MLVYPPNFTKQSQKNLIQLTEHLTATFTKVSDWIHQGLNRNAGGQLQIEIKQLLEELHQSKQMIQNAQESLKYNPYASKSIKELALDQQRIHSLTKGYSYLDQSVEILIAWGISGSMTAENQKIWADQVKALAPLFQETSADRSPPSEYLHVSIAKELENQQYFIALFNKTAALLKDN